MSEKIETVVQGSQEVAMQLNPMSQMAFSDFEKALTKAFWQRWLRRLARKPNRLLSFDEVTKRKRLLGQRSLGLMTVAIKCIIGSVGRAEEFDGSFLPRSERTQERWTQIDRAWRAGKHLPPVELYKVGDAYFVVDGNHRVSVAHSQGQDYIDAQVTEIDLSATITSEIPVVRCYDN
jgi:hypothetical protein